MSSPLPARLFGPGVPATGMSAELTFFGDQIEARAGEVLARARMAEVRIREVGFGRPMGLELAWDDVDGTRAIQVLDPSAVQQLRALPLLASSAQMQALHAASKRKAVVRSAGWLVIAIIVLLPFLLIAAFIWQSDRIAGWVAERIPLQQEIELGDRAFADLRSSLSLRDEGPAYDAVKSLGQRLSQGSRFDYRFHVAADESINAFALPGGIIVVHTGLISATHRAEELAGVLAHEIQHVEQRHSLRGAFKQLGLRGLWALVTGDVGATVLGQAALELSTLQFSRSDESSADARGMDTLIEHDVDPRGMIDFFATMEKASGPKPPPFLSTHPQDRDRQQALLARLAGAKQRSYPPLEMGSWPPALQ
ncbi:MAG: M48 family metallopeptidase [Povalibacter sp.]